MQTPYGDATQTAVSDYLKDVLPPLPPEIDLAYIVDVLTTRHSITSNGRWRGFSTDPAATYFHEKNSFRPLSTVVQSIIKASGSETAPSFHHNPLRLMSNLLRKRDEEYLPDGYLSLGSARSCQWSDIWAFAELRKEGSESDVTDVRTQFRVQI